MTMKLDRYKIFKLKTLKQIKDKLVLKDKLSNEIKPIIDLTKLKVHIRNELKQFYLYFLQEKIDTILLLLFSFFSYLYIFICAYIGE